ncbi:MAG: diguanylate cyclase [Myxococcales bacterium]|nr:MAG: diguanylate cyclase [Myxococcales bacterium]
MLALVFAGLYLHEINQTRGFLEDKTRAYVETLQRLDNYQVEQCARMLEENGSLPLGTRPDGRPMSPADCTVPPHGLIAEFSQVSQVQTGMQVRLLSTDPARQKTATPFETEALAMLAAGEPRVLQWEPASDGEILRALYPLPWGPSCAKCHGADRMSGTDPAGVLSVTAPMSQADRAREESFRFAGVLSALLALLFFGMIYIFGWRLTREHLLLQDTMQRHMRHDLVTGMLNRPAVFELLDTEVLRAKRTDAPVAVALVDIDHFQEINDRYGRLVGDAVIRHVATYLKRRLRAYDLIGRTAGEEFLIVFPNTTVKDAAEVAERLRAELAADPVVHQNVAAPVTVSIGVAELRKAEESPDSLFTRVSGALYNAKANGRNRVEIDDLFQRRK